MGCADGQDFAFLKSAEQLCLHRQRQLGDFVQEQGAAIGREEHGIDSAKRAVTLCQSLRDVSGEAAAWTLLGGLHEALGHGPDAEDAFRRSLAIYRQQTLSVHAVRQSSPPAPTVPKESRSPARPSPH